VLGTGPDLIRLLAIPVFGWTAYRDVKTRRVPNRTWYPLALLGVVALVWETYLVLTDPLLFVRPFVLQVALSIGIVVPLAYAFWWIGGFGGADVKALWAVAIVFPTVPTYLLPSTALPLVSRQAVFPMTVLSNTVLVGLAFPFALAVRNLLTGDTGPLMFLARQVRSDRIVDEYGAMLRPAPDDAGLVGSVKHYLSMRASKRGLDLDALRMYLQYRGLTLTQLRADPDYYRDPETLPTDPNPPGDGSIRPGDALAPDGGVDAADGAATDAAETDTTDDTATDAPADESDPTEPDPWGAAAFLDDIDHSAYGTTADNLRWGLDTLVAAEAVWLSPGTPFLVPLFFGLLVSLTYGDLLFGLGRLLGLM
jgi:preflagellin peptidase FlaK